MITLEKKQVESEHISEKYNQKEPRIHPTWYCGDVAFQGDIIFVALSKMPKSIKNRNDRQLADGQTKGSRHILVGGKVFDANKKEIATMLKQDAKMDVSEIYIGPVFSGDCHIEHPQHAHHIFPDHICTAVVYQRNLDSEERETRRRD